MDICACVCGQTPNDNIQVDFSYDIRLSMDILIMGNCVLIIYFKGIFIIFYKFYIRNYFNLE